MRVRKGRDREEKKSRAISYRLGKAQGRRNHGVRKGREKKSRDFVLVFVRVRCGLGEAGSKREEKWVGSLGWVGG